MQSCCLTVKRNPDYGYDTVLYPSYFHNGISYIGKTELLHWDIQQHPQKLGLNLYSFSIYEA